MSIKQSMRIDCNGKGKTYIIKRYLVPVNVKTKAQDMLMDMCKVIRATDNYTFLEQRVLLVDNEVRYLYGTLKENMEG